jgi:hypothetical protein
MSSSSINKSVAVNYVKTDNFNDQACSMDQNSSVQPEETVNKSKPDTANVKNLPKGAVGNTVNLFDPAKNSSSVPKAPVEDYKSLSPDEMVCSEENYFTEPIIEKTPPVEADMQVKMIENKIKASGNITLRKEFITSAVEDALKDNNKVENIKVSFDSKTETYKVSGKYNPDYLPKQNFTLILKPTIEDKKLGLKLDSDDYWGIFNNRIGNNISEEVRGKGINTSYNSNTKVISFDTDSILQKTGELHYTTKADLSKNEISLKTQSNGDLSLNLYDPDVKLAVNKSHHSDVEITMDQKSFQATLQKAFGNNLRILNVDLKEGEANIQGKANAPQVRNGFMAIFALWGYGTGDVSALNSAAQMATSKVPEIDTQIHVSLDGREVVMKPESSLHLQPLAEAMKKEGYKISKVDEKKQEIRFPINELLPNGSSGNINSAKITGDGLTLDGTF